MWCEEREQLEAKLDQARATFRTTMERSRASIAVCPAGEFPILSAILDSAQQNLKAACSAVEQHVREHYCLASEDTGPIVVPSRQPSRNLIC